MKKNILVVVFLILGVYGCQHKCEDAWSICMTVNDYEKNFDGEKIKIAVLDSGIKKNSILEPFLVESYNTFTKDSQTDSINPHGTMVASIIAATEVKNKKIGINRHVELYDIQILNEEGKSDLNHLVAGIKWATEKDVDMIHISAGIQSYNEKLEKAINDAIKKGIIIVAAAGNTLGFSTDYPAKFKDVISISAIDKEKKFLLMQPKVK